MKTYVGGYQQKQTVLVLLIWTLSSLKGFWLWERTLERAPRRNLELGLSDAQDDVEIAYGFVVTGYFRPLKII